MGWSKLAKTADVLKNGEKEARKYQIAIADCIMRHRKSVRK